MPRTVVRAADFGPPHRVGDEDFGEICRISDIATKDRAAVREFLDEAVRAFGDAIAGAQALPDRKDDRLALERAIAALKRARLLIGRPAGLAGRFGLRIAGRGLAPALSGAWMRARFPDDPAKPHPVMWPADSSRTDGRSPEWIPERPIDADALSLGERSAFMERRAGAAIAALLADVARALDSGRRGIVQLPDGPQPLERRAYMLAGLANLWRMLRRRPTSGINSPFGVFAENVFDAIGWPTEGVNAALPDAIKLWRRLYGCRG